MADHAQLDQLTITPADDTPANHGVPTQVANPRRATLRTALAVLAGIVTALPVLSAALLIVQDELTKSGLDVPPVVWAVITAGLAILALVSLTVTRILALPGVNAWIVAYLPALAAIKPVSVTEESVPAVTGSL